MTGWLRTHRHTLVVLVVGLAGFLFRVPRLDLRPLHADEAVHAVKLGELLQTGTYIYNPHEYHGPTLYYFTIPLMRALGVHNLAQIGSQWTLLIIPVIFGSLLIIAPLLLKDALGWRACTIAALLTAISPAMTFYSRYYIQEMLLVLFAFLTIACAYRMFASAARARYIWCVLLAACAGLTLATKETSLLLFGTALAAAVLSARPRATLQLLRSRTAPILAAALLALAIFALLITNFFRNSHALADAAGSVINYVSRAITGDSSTHGSDAHRQPWYFYIQRLAWFREHPAFMWSEGIILVLGLIGVAFAPRNTPSPFVRFLAIYTAALTIIYSVIPYKTPWNALPFLHGWILLAGIGFIAFHDALPNRALRQALSGLFVIGIIQLGWQAYRTNFRFPADTRNPYVYAGTSTDLVNLAQQVEKAAAVSGEKHSLRVQVAAAKSDYWPLPWYLRHFPNTGYWSEVPELADAAVIISSPELEDQLAPKLHNHYIQSTYGLRSGVLLTLRVEETLWQQLIRASSPSPSN